MTQPQEAAGGSRVLGIVLVTITAAAWGGAWVVARGAAGLAPPLWNSVGRFVMAAAVLWPVAAAMRRPVSLRHDASTWKVLVGMGLTGAIGYNVFFLLGIELAPASDGAVLTPGLAGLSGVLWAFILDGSRPRPRALLGGALATAGALAIGWSAWQASAASPDRLVGDVLFFAAALVWGVYTVLGRRLVGKVPAVESIFWTTVIGAVLLMPVAWLISGPPAIVPGGLWPLGAWLNMAYLGIAATAVGFVTWYLAVQHLGPDGVAPGLGLVPVFGVTLAMVFLDEALSWGQALGAALVIAGIVVGNASASRKQAAKASAGAAPAVAPRKESGP